MIGNVETDFRIDGWSDGEWFEAENVSISGEHPFIQTEASLTMNLEDGSLSGKHHVDARLGFICQGESGVGKGCAARNLNGNVKIQPKKEEKKPICEYTLSYH